MKKVERILNGVVGMVRVFKYYNYTRDEIYTNIKAYLIGTLGLNLSNKKDSKLIDVAFNKIYDCNSNANNPKIINEILMEVL